MGADVPIPHSYRESPFTARGRLDGQRFCLDCFALPTELTFAEHHARRDARCGRSDEHGAHRTTERPYWCAGNRGIVIEEA